MANPVLMQLSEVLFEPPYKIIAALCEVFDDTTAATDNLGLNPDDLANTIISLFIVSGRTANLLSELMRTEIKNTIDETTLFRRNCMITKLLTVFCNRIGLKYLQRAMKPVLGLVPSFNIEDYELDKNRNSNLTDEKLEDNVQNAIQLCQDCVDVIVKSEPIFPPGLRKVCKELHLQVKPRFPNSEYSCIGGLIFLRFICPAVISPEKSKLLPEGALSPKHRRILVLVSKILQNISNKIVSTAKEAYMQKMNSFVRESIPVVNNFFKQLAERESDPNAAVEFNISEMEKIELLERMCLYLKFNIHKLGAVLVSGTTLAKKVTAQMESEKLGYLYKYGENIVTDAWRKRWFILRGNQLLYFKDVQDSHAAGIIPLTDASISYINKEEFTFEIETPYRCYRLKGASVLDAVSWFKAVDHVINANHSRSIRQSTALSRVGSCSSIMMRSAAGFSPPKPTPAPSPSPAPTTNDSGSKWVKPTITKDRSNSESSPRTKRLTLSGSLNPRAQAQSQTARVSTSEEKPHPFSLSRRNSDKIYPATSSRGANRGQRGTDKGGLPGDRSRATKPTERGRSSYPARGAPSVRGPNSDRGRGARGHRGRGSTQPPRGAPAATRGAPTRGNSHRGSIPPTRGTSNTNIPAPKGSREPAHPLRKPPGRARVSGGNGVQRREVARANSEEAVRRANIPKQEKSSSDTSPTQWNRITNSRASPQRQKILQAETSHRSNLTNSGNRPVSIIDGILKRRNFEKHSWDSHKYEVSNFVLTQLDQNDQVMETIPLLGTVFSQPTTGSPNCFELKRNNSKIVLQTPNQSECSRWLERLQEASVRKDTFRSTCFTLQKDSGVTIPVWLELYEEKIKVFEILPSENRLMMTLESSEAVVRTLESGDGFVINDTTYSVSVTSKVPQEIKAWTTEIKCAKLNFWKRKKEQNRASSPISAPAPSRIDMLFRPGTGKGFIAGPPLEETSPIALETGYLLKIEKDRKTWNRVWTTLNKGVLWCYRTDISSKPTARVDLAQMHIKTFDIEGDDFQFEIFDPANTETSTLFEASDPVDLNTWLTTIQKQIVRFSEVGHKASISSTGPVVQSTNPTHSGYLTKSTSDSKTDKGFWFVVKDYSLQWFANENDNTPIDTVSLKYCQLKQPSENIIEILAPETKDPIVIKVPEGNSNPEEWPNVLLNAKKHYWRSNAMLNSVSKHFTNRGYLMRLEGKRWIRRWFIMLQNYLLFYKGPKEPNPLGEIVLDSSCSVEALASRENQLRLEISWADRFVQLESCSTQNLNLWIKTLQNGKEICLSPIDDSSDGESAIKLEQALRNPECEGFLMKQGVTRKSWKRRWFVLKFPTLYYFSSAQISPGEQAGCIPLREAHVVIKVQDNTFTRSVQFQIETRERIFFLRADTEEDVFNWVEAIYRSKSSLKFSHALTDNKSSTTVNSLADASDRVGYLVKKGRTNKVWKKRWFTLTSNSLVYFKSMGDSDAAGDITLNQDCSVTIADESIKRKFCFIVSTRYRNYFLQASDQFEMAAWIESIRYHCRTSKEQASTSTADKDIKLFNKLNDILASHDKLRQP